MGYGLNNTFKEENFILRSRRLKPTAKDNPLYLQLWQTGTQAGLPNAGRGKLELRHQIPMRDMANRNSGMISQRRMRQTGTQA